PLFIRVAGARLDALEKQHVRDRLGRMLDRFGPDITRGTVRFIDVNGPRGGIDIACRLKLSVTGLDHIHVEARAGDARTALRIASVAVQNAVVRAMGRRGRTAQRIEDLSHEHDAMRWDAVEPLGASVEEEISRTRHASVLRPEGGSLMGRRVGRSRANLL